MIEIKIIAIYLFNNKQVNKMINKQIRLNTKTFLKNLTIDNENKDLINYLIDYRNNIDNKINECENLILTGSCGSGKSYILNAFMNDVVNIKAERQAVDYSARYGIQEIITKSNITAKMINIYNLITDLRDKDYKNKDVIDYKNFDILIIDEVGVQFSTDAERQILYSLIDYRYNNFKPTFIISNFDLAGGKNENSIDKILGQRILTRLKLNNCRIFKLNTNKR